MYSSKQIKNFERSIGFVQVLNEELIISGTDQSNENALRIVAGMGDGNYEVFGTFQHVPGVGPRITSIRVEFISQEELKWMDRQLLETNEFY